MLAGQLFHQAAVDLVLDVEEIAGGPLEPLRPQLFPVRVSVRRTLIRKVAPSRWTLPETT